MQNVMTSEDDEYDDQVDVELFVDTRKNQSNDDPYVSGRDWIKQSTQSIHYMDKTSASLMDNSISFRGVSQLKDLQDSSMITTGRA